MTIALILCGSALLIALAPPPPPAAPPVLTPEEELRQTMQVRLAAGLADPRTLSLAVVEYWADRYVALDVGGWTGTGFRAYLADVEAAEFAARTRRLTHAAQQAQMRAAMGPAPTRGVAPGTFPADALVLN